MSLIRAGLSVELWCVGHSPPEVKVDTVPRALVVKCGQNIGIEIPYKGLYRCTFAVLNVIAMMQIFLLNHGMILLFWTDLIKCRPPGARSWQVAVETDGCENSEI